MNFYCDQLRLGQRWALRMRDASAESPGGVYGGQLMHLGQFDECLRVSVTQPSSDAFVGKYCLAEYSLSEIESDRPDQEYKDFQMWHWLQVLERENFLNKTYRRRAVIQMAWCLPSTCSSGDLADMLVHYVNDESVHIHVPENKCHTSAASSLRIIDIVSLCIFGVLIVLAILSTVYDCLTAPKDSLLLLQRANHRQNFILAFSLIANWRRIFAEYSPSNLKCINGLRVLSLGWVVLGHTLLYYNTQVPYTVVNHDLQQSQETQYMGFTNANLAADTFFFLSGLLICYKYLEQVENEEFSIIKYYIHRFIRVTPALAITVLLSVSLLNHVGSGPLWNSIHDEVMKNCEANWWSTLLHVNNYVNPEAKCLPQSWYLSVSMQLFWLSPLVLIPLWKYPLIGKCWMGLLLLLGIAAPFTITYLTEIRAGNILLLQDKELNKLNNYYYEATYTRFSAWLVGMVVGYILHKSRNVKHRSLPKKFVALGWTSAAALTLSAIYAQHPFQQARAVAETPYPMRLDAAFYLALHRTAWALGVGWVAFACTHRCGGFVTSILSWRLFEPLSRLSYGIFLTHISVINLLVGISRTPVHISDFNTCLMFWIVFSLSTLCAMPLVLLCEFPALALERAMYGKDATDAVVEEAQPAELPPQLQSPIPFRRPTSMFALPEMREVTDDSDGLRRVYSVNLDSVAGFQKPAYSKELLIRNSEHFYDVPDTSRPASSIYYEISPYMASEKITNFNNLSPVTQVVVTEDNENCDRTPKEELNLHRAPTSNDATGIVLKLKADDGEDMREPSNQKVSIDRTIPQSPEDSTSDDDVRL